MTAIDLRRHLAALPREAPLAVSGRVVELTGGVVRALVEDARLGDAVELLPRAAPPLLAEVVGFRGDEAVLTPLGPAQGLCPGTAVRAGTGPLAIEVGDELLGRVLDALGKPIDGRPAARDLTRWPVSRPPPPPMERPAIAQPLQLGLRALDGLLTAGKGQRLGLFAGSGVGKSTLLSQLVRGSGAQVVVAALVGERGREVRDFVDRTLGATGRERSVVVAATSEAPAALRIKAAEVATAVAEWFADVRGLEVLLVLDSLTRYARALREVGLAAGEPPARQGYPPSVFAALPRLLERAGPRRRGSITAVYAVLVAGGDLDEPVADEVRGLLDGHVVLDCETAARGRFPAIDVLKSVSRAMPEVATARHLALARRLRSLLGAWERQRDLVAMEPTLGARIPRRTWRSSAWAGFESYLRQDAGECSTLDGAVDALEALLA